MVVVHLTVASFAVAEEPDRETRVVQLRQDYGATRDRVERLVIASKLARAGDYSYWSFVRREAIKAVQHDRVRVPWYIRLLRFGHLRPQTYRSMNYMLLPTEGTVSQPVKEKLADNYDVNAYTLDVWRMLAFSSATRHEERELQILREAVRSPRSLIAAYAALGLARLRDQESAQTIADAGFRAKDAERILFVEALVCLNSEKATKLARQVAGENVAVLQAIQELAPRKQYNPFAER